MSLGLDGIRKHPKQKRPHINKKKESSQVVLYPDLDLILPTNRQQSNLPIKKDQTLVVNKKSSPQRELKNIKRKIFFPGFSWFMIMAVLSSSAIGVFSVVQSGLASKDEIASSAGQAKQHLTEATKALGLNELDQATAEFSAAFESFSTIQTEIDDLSRVMRGAVRALPGNVLGSAQNLTQSGLHLATAGKSLSKVMGNFSDVDIEGLAPPSLQSASQGEIKTSLTEALKAADSDFEIVVSELTQATALVAQVDIDALPGSIADTLKPLVAELPSINKDLQGIRGLLGVVAQMAGADRARTYAIVFQNNNELRPTGGFMGAFAFLKIQNGRVEKLDIKSIYDPAGQVTSRQAAPDGLNIISETFSLQDANWFAEFPTSSETLLDFFKETGDPRIDGVIALNPQIVTELLALTGPVKLEALGISVSEDNFTEEAQYEVEEKDPDRDNNFFPSLADGLFSNLFDQEQGRWLDFLQIMFKGVARKDIQIYFVEPELQALSNMLGSDGTFPAQDTDLLAVIESNIGGGKTDQFIQEERQLTIDVSPDRMRHELLIKRVDTRSDQFKDRDNRSYMRVYVPQGSKLISASGFDRDVKELLAYDCSDCDSPKSEQPLTTAWEQSSNTRILNYSDWTVYENWITLAPGEERNIKLIYDVPLELLNAKDNFSVYVWRQPGIADDLTHDLVIRDAGRSVLHVTEAQKGANGFAKRFILNNDSVTGVLLE